MFCLFASLSSGSIGCQLGSNVKSNLKGRDQLFHPSFARNVTQHTPNTLCLRVHTPNILVYRVHLEACFFFMSNAVTSPLRRFPRLARQTQLAQPSGVVVPSPHPGLFGALQGLTLKFHSIV